MKNWILSLAVLISSCGVVHAGMEEYNYPPSSSYTEAATLGPVVFSTGAIRWIAILISSPAPSSSVALFRTTSPFITVGLNTQALVTTDYPYTSQSPVTVPLWGIENSSYTLVNKIGAAKITYFFTMIGPSTTYYAGSVLNPPGLKGDGQQ